MRQSEADLALAESERSLAESQLREKQTALQEQAVDAYVGKDRLPDTADLITNAKDLSSAVVAAQYMGTIVQNTEDLVEEKRDLEGRARDLRDAAESKKSSIQQDRDAVLIAQTDLLDRRAGLDELRTALQADIDEQRRLLDEAEAKRSEFEARIVSLERESQRIAQQLRTPNAGPKPAPGSGLLASPSPGARISSPYGMRVHPIFGTLRLHNGTDFAAGMGAPIRAAADGTVVTASMMSGYGNYTCIDHGSALATCYAHQNRIDVSKGERVSRGEVIGTVGSTGNSTGPHLHFEVRVNGSTVDPQLYL